MPLQDPHVMPIRKRFAHVYKDGEYLEETVQVTVSQGISTESSAVLSQQGRTTYETDSYVKGHLKCNRFSPWLQDIAERQFKGEIVRFDLQTIHDDPNSDYSKNHGAQTYTFIDCVITSDIPLVSADREGTIVQDEFDFEARTYVRS